MIIIDVIVIDSMTIDDDHHRDAMMIIIDRRRDVATSRRRAEGIVANATMPSALQRSSAAEGARALSGLNSGAPLLRARAPRGPYPAWHTAGPRGCARGRPAGVSR